MCDDALQDYYLCWQSAGLVFVLHTWQTHDFRETADQLAALMVHIHGAISK